MDSLTWSSSLVVDLATEKQRAKRQRPIRADGTPGQVAGAATEYSPSSKLIIQNGLPNRFPPESPCPGHPTLDQNRTAALNAAVSCPERR